MAESSTIRTRIFRLPGMSAFPCRIATVSVPLPVSTRVPASPAAGAGLAGVGDDLRGAKPEGGAALDPAEHRPADHVGQFAASLRRSAGRSATRRPRPGNRRRSAFAAARARRMRKQPGGSPSKVSCTATVSASGGAFRRLRRRASTKNILSSTSATALGKRRSNRRSQSQGTPRVRSSSARSASGRNGLVT